MNSVGVHQKHRQKHQNDQCGAVMQQNDDSVGYCVCKLTAQPFMADSNGNYCKSLQKCLAGRLQPTSSATANASSETCGRAKISRSNIATGISSLSRYGFTDHKKCNTPLIVFKCSCTCKKGNKMLPLSEPFLTFLWFFSYFNFWHFTISGASLACSMSP